MSFIQTTSNKEQATVGTAVVFEGGEGSGKGTITKKLYEYLQKLNVDVHLTREPGGLPICEDIRNLILSDKAEKNNMTAMCEAYLYAASRTELIQHDILPELHRGKFIIIDRFVYSSYVYQGIVEGIGVNKVKTINSYALQDFKPNAIFYLDLEPEIGLARIKKDGIHEVNRFDRKDIEFHKKVRQGYLSLADVVDDYYVIDASKTIDEVFTDVLLILKEKELLFCSF